MEVGRVSRVYCEDAACEAAACEAGAGRVAALLALAVSPMPAVSPMAVAATRMEVGNARWNMRGYLSSLWPAHPDPSEQVSGAVDRSPIHRADAASRSKTQQVTIA